MKVSELTGAQLDYWVAQNDPQCIGLSFERCGDHIVGLCDIDGEKVSAIFIHGGNVFASLRLRKQYNAERYSPSTHWSQGGPIIEREGIHLTRGDNGQWEAQVDRQNHERMYLICKSEFPLIAAMRAYVASKFGDEVPIEEAA